MYKHPGRTPYLEEAARHWDLPRGDHFGVIRNAGSTRAMVMVETCLTGATEQVAAGYPERAIESLAHAAAPLISLAVGLQAAHEAIRKFAVENGLPEPEYLAGMSLLPDSEPETETEPEPVNPDPEPATGQGQAKRGRGRPRKDRDGEVQSGGGENQGPGTGSGDDGGQNPAA